MLRWRRTRSIELCALTANRATSSAATERDSNSATMRPWVACTMASYSRPSTDTAAIAGGHSPSTSTPAQSAIRSRLAGGSGRSL